MPRATKSVAVLNYWHSVEIFTPQNVPKVDPTDGVHNGVNQVGSWPWMPGHDATKGGLEPHQTWRHQVFCGLFDIERVSHHLTKVLHAERETSEQRPPGQSAVASFFVTSDGFAVPGTLTISTCAWAVGRASEPGPGDAGWLTGFDEKRVALEEAFVEYSGAMPAPAADEDETDKDQLEEQKPAEPAPGRYLDTKDPRRNNFMR